MYIFKGIRNNFKVLWYKAFYYFFKKFYTRNPFSVLWVWQYPDEVNGSRQKAKESVGLLCFYRVRPEGLAYFFFQPPFPSLPFALPFPLSQIFHKGKMLQRSVLYNLVSAGQNLYCSLSLDFFEWDHDWLWKWEWGELLISKWGIFGVDDFHIHKKGKPTLM